MCDVQESRRQPYNTVAMERVENGECGFTVGFIISVIPFRKAQEAGISVTDQLREEEREQQKPLRIQLRLT